MPIVNNLRKQVDLPVWEWSTAPFSPTVSSTTSASCTCAGDSSAIDVNNGRFIYYSLGNGAFWRYDTVSNSYQQLASLLNTARDAAAMQFRGDMGYYNRAISATSTTLTTGLPSGKAAIGYKIKIISGTGVGQERIIMDVSDPAISDFGNATAGAAVSLTDTNKSWFGSSPSSAVASVNSYTGTTANVNGWAGYVVRTIPFGTGPNQVRKILYNSSTVLTVSDPGMQPYEPYCNAVWTAPAAGTIYQIESSTISVDTAWDITPDQTSRFLILSGAIFYITNIASGYLLWQYYDVLQDTWYTLPSLPNAFGSSRDLSMASFSDTLTTWWRGMATNSGTLASITQTNANWTKDEWKDNYVYIFSGTGRGQISKISANSDSNLVIAPITTATDETSRYEIIGYDGGTSTGSNTYNTIVDSTKSWITNQYANYAVRILSGKGAGQLIRIVSNTGSALTVNRGWNITPDNTSIYIIQSDANMLLSSGTGNILSVYSLSAQASLQGGRVYDYGVACILAALRCDSNHNIEDVGPIALSGLSGTTVITATSIQAHGLKVGDYVSIRGVTSAAADIYNITGLVQVTSVPSTTTFTYTPYIAGTGTYGYLAAQSTSSTTDASKSHRDIVSSATNTSITFARITPSNINGWFVAGTNVTAGTTVVSGAGTAVIQLSGGSAVPSGVIVFSAWSADTAAGAAAITGVYSSGGGAGVATVTLTANTPSIDGWLVTGTGIAVNTYVTSGGGTSTIVLSNACTGAVSGNLTFYPPRSTGKLMITTTSTSTATTGATTYQTSFISSSVASTVSNFSTAGLVAPTSGTSRYMLTDIPTIGGDFDGSSNNYYFGVTTGGSTTTIVDSNAFWATATGSGSAQSTTITLSATAPGNVNGWFITGTGISTGTRIISGAGTTTLTLNIPTSGAVSGIMTCCAWGPSGGSSYLVGKSIKSLGGANNALFTRSITAVTTNSGTITFATASAIAAGGCYSIISLPSSAGGLNYGYALKYVYGNGPSGDRNRGRFIWAISSAGTNVISKIDLNTDRVYYLRTCPLSETFGSGSYFAYDGGNMIYMYKDAIRRMYSLNVNNDTIIGAGTVPYIDGAADGGNRMEIYQTIDRLKFIWLNRNHSTEHFRVLLY